MVVCSGWELTHVRTQYNKTIIQIQISHTILFHCSLNVDEERDLSVIDTFLPDVTSPFVLVDQMYCFHTSGRNMAPSDPLKTFGLVLKNSQHLITGMCVTDRRSILDHIGIEYLLSS